LNTNPKLFSIGQPTWQAEQGKPYFRAKAGMAWAGGRLRSIPAKISNSTGAPERPWTARAIQDGAFISASEQWVTLSPRVLVPMVTKNAWGE